MEQCKCETGNEILEGITHEAHDKLHVRISSLEAEADKEGAEHLKFYGLWRASEARAEAAEKAVESWRLAYIKEQNGRYSAETERDVAVELLRIEYRPNMHELECRTSVFLASLSSTVKTVVTTSGGSEQCKCETGNEILEGITHEAHDKLHVRISSLEVDADKRDGA